MIKPSVRRPENWTVRRLIVVAVVGGFALPTAAAQFPVTKLTDGFDGVCDADCSLREAIQAANDTPGTDEIVLPAGLFRLSLTGAGEDWNETGDLDIREQVEIVGAGEGLTTIDGSASNLGDRILDIWVGPVEIRDMTINGGTALGGAGDQMGGGILNRHDLTVRRCTIMNNETAGSGGGVHTHLGSTLFMADSTIVDNDAQVGGGISNWGGLVYLTNCQVLNNAVGDAVNCSGGGLSSTGASSPITGGDLTIVGSLIQGNTSTGPGGGVHIANGEVEISDSSIDGNTAGRGGGIYMSTEVNLDLTRGSVSHNDSTGRGGGLYARVGLHVRGTTFDDNQGSEGGAVYVDSGVGCCSPVPIEDATFSNNSVSQRFGGAVYVATGTAVVGSTFTGNESIANPTAGPSAGGAIYVDIGGWLRLVNSTIYDNLSSSCAVYCPGFSKIRNSTIVGNTATVGSVAGICGEIDIANSIVANNLSGSDCTSVDLTSSGYNIESGVSCDFTSTGDQQSTTPMVGLLADNGGSTQTLALLAGSPAIDGGDPAGCNDGGLGVLLVDQRGYARDVDGDSNASAICDVGAFEYASYDFGPIFGDGFENGDLSEWDSSIP